jgi:hypothetical protein
MRFKFPIVIVRRKQLDAMKDELARLKVTLSEALQVIVSERYRADSAMRELNMRMQQWNQMAEDRATLRRLRGVSKTTTNKGQ